ncbi:MAG: DUF4407 domain-containing protein [Chitinophagales bacterium]|nr:DUF4407 domain-containing protein [Chitinophagales bacterium]
MRRDYYVTPKPSWVMRQFWRAAGGDRFILERSTYSDQVKYMCLGGIIVATGVMAGIAGGYAFYTIFETRGSAIEQQFNLSVSVLSIVFGLIWGLMIFNIDRFIVTSTGKGDGTEAITWEEFKGAIPRIIMGAIIAITISKPVEIRMFKTEIDTQLHTEQMKVKQAYLKGIDSVFYDRIESEKLKIAKWESEIKEKEARYVELENIFTRETTGELGARGYGPEAKQIEEQLSRLEAEIGAIKAKNAGFIQTAWDNISKFEKEKLIEIENAGKKADNLDGLLERIKIAHDVAGIWITLFITLLFMAIELTPIFFKLMLVKTPYDFLEDNIKELIKAEEGIAVVYNYYKDKEGQERDLVQYVNAEKVINTKIDTRETERRLAIYALEAYESAMKKKIDQNPEAFVKQNDNGQKEFNI